MSAGQKKAALKLAQCMRANGVPSFPDPASASGASGGATQKPLQNADSPAFEHAVQVCGRGGRLEGHDGSIEGS